MGRAYGFVGSGNPVKSRTRARDTGHGTVAREGSRGQGYTSRLLLSDFRGSNKEEQRFLPDLSPKLIRSLMLFMQCSYLM